MEPVLLRALLVAGLLATVLLAGWAWRARDGRVRRVDAAPDAPKLATAHLERVGLDLDGADAGAVLLGSPTCAPCDHVKQVLGDLAQERGSFRWVYADAGEHLDLTADLRVLRVPTLLVVGPSGRILARTSGVPRVDDLRRVLDEGDDLGGLAA